MARPLKDGVSYFPLDTELDDGFDLIEAKHGPVGFTVIIKMYQKIYKDFGYFYPWAEREQLLFARKTGISMETVNLVIQDAATFGLFNKKLFETGILTSHGIQIRYLEIVKRRKKLNLFQDIMLISDEEIDNYSTKNGIEINYNVYLTHVNVTQIGDNVTLIGVNDNIMYTSCEHLPEKSKHQYTKHSKVKHSKVKQIREGGEPSAPAVPAVYENTLDEKIKKAFLVYGRFTDYKKEIMSIKRIIKLGDHNDGMIQAMMETFWRLRQVDQKFWAKQPFLPSVMVTSWIWDKIKNEMELAKKNVNVGEELAKMEQQIVQESI
jgi:hypothetical protein